MRISITAALFRLREAIFATHMQEDTFGRRLAKARKEAKLSQPKLAEKAGFNIKVISRYELDRASPSVEAAARLAKALGTSLDRLSGLEGTSQDPELERLCKEALSLSEQHREALRIIMRDMLAARELASLAALGEDDELMKLSKAITGFSEADKAALKRVLRAMAAASPQ